MKHFFAGGLFALLVLVWAAVQTAAAEPIQYTLRIGGADATVLRPGPVTARITCNAQEPTNALLLGAVYQNGVPEAVHNLPVTLEPGENVLDFSGVSVSESDTRLRLMLWDQVTLQPLWNQPIQLSRKPEIQEAQLTLTSGSGALRTYNGLIDPEHRTVTIPVPITYCDAQGNIKELSASSPGAYGYGTPTQEEYDAQLTSTEPILRCGEDAVVETPGSLDLSRPQTVTVRTGDGETQDYRLRVQDMVLQKDMDFSKAGITLVVPSRATFGLMAQRHGAPDPIGTQAGNGVWYLDGFAYQKDAEGYYLAADGHRLGRIQGGSYQAVGTGAFVRDPDSAGYLEPDSGRGLHFRSLGSDQTFALYSVYAAAPSRRVDMTDSTVRISVAELSGGSGLSIYFGSNRFLVRITPGEKENMGRLWFGSKEGGQPSLQDTGADIPLGEDTVYTFQCLVEKLTDDRTRGVLYLNGVYVCALEMETHSFYDLYATHVRFEAESGTRCHAILRSWKMSYSREETPAEITELYDRLWKEQQQYMLWAATLYEGGSYGDDPQNGHGFFYAPSSKANPQRFCAELESTGQMVAFMNRFGLLNYMPQDIQRGLVRFFRARYDPDTGYYNDLMPSYYQNVNDRQVSRNLGYGNSSLRQLTTVADSSNSAYDPVRARAAQPVLLCDGFGEAAAALTLSQLPIQYQSLENFKLWLENRLPGASSMPWDTHSWTAGDLLCNAPTYLKKIPEGQQEDYWRAAVDFLLRRQNDNGTFGPMNYAIEVSGLFKVSVFLDSVPAEIMNEFADRGVDADHRMPRAQAVYDYIMENLETADFGNILIAGNTMSVLYAVEDLVDGSRMERDMPEILETVARKMQEFKLDRTTIDGGSEYATEARTLGGQRVLYSNEYTGMGYNQSIGLSEGCINAGNSLGTLYEVLNRFYGLPYPKVDKAFAMRFYDILQQETETGEWERYYKENYGMTPEKQRIEEHFRQEELNQPPLPAQPEVLFSYTPQSGGASTALVKAADGDQALEFTFRPSETGASISLSNLFLPEISPGEKACLSFRMKLMPGNFSGNYIYFGIPNTAFYSLFLTQGRFRINNRTSPNGITEVSGAPRLLPNQWYQIRMEVDHSGVTNRLRLYVDDTLCDSSDLTYSGAINGASGFAVTSYMRADGAAWFDDIVLEIR